MKTKKSFFSKWILIVFALVLPFVATLFLPAKNVLAENNNVVMVNDSHVQMKMTSRGRTEASVAADPTVVHNALGQDVLFYCFNWKDLHNLNFQFSVLDETVVSSYKFLMTYVRSESLSPAFGTNDAVTIYESRNINQSDFTFYIDPATSAIISPNAANGYGFGLYKFDLSYFRLVDNENVNNHVEIYVAVIPDNINEIEVPLGTQITYYISSSNRLMNIFNCNISSNVFRFVNPDHLQWEVVGEDTFGTSYCLDKKMKEKMEYGAYEALWDVLDSTTGTSFVFDSNDVEGTWTVMLSIKNSDGSEKATLKVENLSTIKVKKAFRWWIVLIIIFGTLLLIGLVTTIVMVVRKKREKVW